MQLESRRCIGNHINGVGGVGDKIVSEVGYGEVLV